MRELGWRDESERICQFSEASFLHPVFVGHSCGTRGLS